ncbi:hypothetical protein A0J61_07484 [Choanephora cucurbitarum]|uniref:Uncharacterized protein n=1 Tax=Choanephora cucurbitarum TaxID=101091 RepID=A0A1C7N5P7_9FUNG|nr:hypothetical protein A0J61_07484 [Choanephora cucurbitarum]
MTGSPKFPRNGDNNYLLSEEMRRAFVKQDYLLRMPVSSFGDFASHLNNLPEDKLLELNSEDVYVDIKSALYKIMTNTKQFIEIPAAIKPFVQQTYNYFSSKKAKDRFMKEYKLEVESKEPRIRQRKIAQARKNTYQKAQFLGIDLTNKGLDEFAQEYSNASETTSRQSPEIISANYLSQTQKSRRSPEASKIQDLPETTVHCSSPMKKSCMLNKNKKKFVIFNIAAYLTSPNKPKIQYVDREQMKDWCEIAMESLIDCDTDINEEVVKEYKRCSENQKNLASFNSFPGVSDFLNDVLKADKEDFPEALWKHEKRREATGIARTFMNIICYTLTDFHSNCKQITRNSSNHERTSFAKYIIPMFKYFSQETNLIEFSWCEKSLETYGIATLENNNYVTSYSDRKYADALGKNTLTDSEEFFIESSSGFEKENVNHSLDDTLKLLAECSGALLYIIKQNKKAGIDTMTKKSTFGIQVIKKTLTLTKVTLSKTGKWNVVEVRSSCTPTCWGLRGQWKPLFEMMATIYLELLEQQKLDATILEEVCGLKVLSSESVTDYFSNANHL